jgi:hypothetical protein
MGCEETYNAMAGADCRYRFRIVTHRPDVVAMVCNEIKFSVIFAFIRNHFLRVVG